MPPNLRSRQVNPLPQPSKSPPTKALIKKPSPSAAPTTPNPAHEPPNSSGRRSLRLASKVDSGSGDGDGASISPDSSRNRRRSTGKSVIEMDSSRAGKGFSEFLNVVSDTDTDSDDDERKTEEANLAKKRKLGDRLGSSGGEFLSLGSGSGATIIGKGKEILIIDSDEEGGEVIKIPDSDERDSTAGVRRLSREEKGKGVMMDCDTVSVDLDLKLGVVDIDLNVEFEPDLMSDQVPMEVNVGEVEGVLDAVVGGVEPGNVINYGSHMMVEQRLRQHKVIAKQNASRFARVNTVEPVENENDVDSDAEKEAAKDPDGQNVEDWPGPFSTAMKIVRDRENKGSAQAQHLCVDKSGVPMVVWKPNIEEGCKRKTRDVPSLHDLCMKALVKNSDAIASLEGVPEVLVHKLVARLCRSRNMTGHILGLLLRGSPSEIRIADCSWIAEEQFAESFEACNTEKLMVLQLDQCGRCMPDYTVQITLAKKGLPVLTTISLKGACRLSDIGLKALISSAPALRSLNLSQCSLITETGIDAIADTLGSGLRELYLDDCQTLNVMRILPALERLTNLEVLSLVGIPSVCDKFLQRLIKSIGRNIKELALADCVKLSDKSLKVIGENCSQLCALDLINVTKVSDSGIGYLANCCQSIQTLKLCRNTFSDEAIAAFLEACGESLTELSLNNVIKVGPHTSISIARRCKSLVRLDVSWCRSLTDECLGLIADSCSSLRVLKVFGCTQITGRFGDGHSNQDLHVIGIKLTPILENLKERDLLCGPLLYSAVSPS